MTPALDPNQWKIWNLFVTCLKASLKPICDAFETYLKLSCYLPKANWKATWNLSETCLKPIWNMSTTYLKPNYNQCDPCLKLIWNLPETNLPETYMKSHGILAEGQLKRIWATWSLSGTYLKPIWNVSETRPKPTRNLPEPSLELIWELSRTYLKPALNLPETNMLPAWNLSETCPSQSETYLSRVQFSCFRATAIALKSAWEPPETSLKPI